MNLGRATGRSVSACERTSANDCICKVLKGTGVFMESGLISEGGAGR